MASRARATGSRSQFLRDHALQQEPAVRGRGARARARRSRRRAAKFHAEVTFRGRLCRRGVCDTPTDGTASVIQHCPAMEDARALASPKLRPSPISRRRRWRTRMAWCMSATPTPESGACGKRKGFAYVSPDNRSVTDAATLARIASLAIPPAYADVWICADGRGHLQATGRDVRRRKQYRYHHDWRLLRDSAKFQRMIEFGDALPRLRRRVRRDLAREGLPREKVLAAIVSLLDATWIRVGNAEYARDNDSYGLDDAAQSPCPLPALGSTAVSVSRQGRRRARGRSRRQAARAHRTADVTSSRDSACSSISTMARGTRSIPGRSTSISRTRWARSSPPRIFAPGARHCRRSRSWRARRCPSRRANHALNACIVAAVKQVAAQLRNTPAVCRKSYINPIVFVGWRNGVLHKIIPAGRLHGAEQERADGAGLSAADGARSRVNLCRSDPECGRVARVAARRARRGPHSGTALRGGQALGACRTGQLLLRQRRRRRPDALECACDLVRNSMPIPTSPRGVTSLDALPPSALTGLRRGIEKESLRVRPDGTLATTPHPARLGSALTHPARHHRLQRVAARAHHRRARQRGCAASRSSPRSTRSSTARSATSCSGARACRAVCRRTTPSRSAATAAPTSAGRRASTGRDFRIATAGACRRSPGIHYNFSLPGDALQRGVLRADPQLPAPFLVAALPLRRLARGVRELRRRPGARARAAERGHALPAPRDFAAHGPAGLPERRAVLARGELQQPRKLRRFAAGGADQALPGLRGDRHSRRRRLPPARHQPAADRERVLRHDPAEARDPARRAAAARVARSRRRVCRGAPDGPRSLSRRRHHRRHDALSRHVPAALPAARQPARHAAGTRRHRAQPAARRRARARAGTAPLARARTR